MGPKEPDFYFGYRKKVILFLNHEVVCTFLIGIFSLVPDEAIQNAAKRLGISRVTDQTKQQMTKVIDQLLDAGRLNIHDARVCLK